MHRTSQWDGDGRDPTSPRGQFAATRIEALEVSMIRVQDSVICGGPIPCRKAPSCSWWQGSSARGFLWSTRWPVSPPPNRIVLEGRARNLHAIDDIRFDATASGTRVRYRADFRFIGPVRWAEKLMKPAFDRLAARAMAGMEVALNRNAA